jgi:hypothetical protein
VGWSTDGGFIWERWSSERFIKGLLSYELVFCSQFEGISLPARLLLQNPTQSVPKSLATKMNDRQLRTSSAVPSRRPRQPSLRTIDDDKQRERKRALDRKAQRASREKTRSHIAHLEKMVQVLSEKNGSSATGELMEEMNRLHAEIERLRKIIDSIKSVLGVDVIKATTSRYGMAGSRKMNPLLNRPPDRHLDQSTTIIQTVQIMK